MTRSLLLLGTVTLILGGCRGQPEDLFFWIGELRAMDGSPLAGRTLRVERAADVDCSWWEDYRSGRCEFGAFEELTTEADGRFLLELMRFQIETPSGRGSFRITHEDPSGATSELFIFSGGRDLDLPAIVAWPGPVAIAAPTSNGWTASRPEQLPFAERHAPGTPYVEELTEPGTPSARYFDWRVEADGELVWHQLADTAPFDLTEDLVEDFAATLVLEGVEVSYPPPVNLITGNSGGAFHLQVRPPALPLDSGAVLPISRGRDCRINGVDHAPCPATDGALGYFAPEQYTGDDYTNVRWFELDLGELRVPRLVVLRGLQVNGMDPQEEMTIRGSADAVTWRQLGVIPDWFPTEGVYPSHSTRDAYVAVPVGANGEPVRHLRFSGSLYRGLDALREISVFE